MANKKSLTSKISDLKNERDFLLKTELEHFSFVVRNENSFLIIEQYSESDDVWNRIKIQFSQIANLNDCMERVREDWKKALFLDGKIEELKR